MKKILLLLVIFSNFSFGQELVVSTNRNPAILGEQISLEFSIEAKATNFKSPIFKGFRIVSGPNTSSSSSYSFANGKSESKIITKFSFILQTIEEGSFIIPIANVDVKGKKINKIATVRRTVRFPQKRKRIGPIISRASVNIVNIHVIILDDPRSSPAQVPWS